MKFLTLSEGKSGKREVAVALLMLWAYLTGYISFWIPGAEVEFYERIYDTATWAIMAFAAGAFGLDFYMKNRGPRQDGPEDHRGAV